MAEVKIAADSGGGSVGLAGPSSTTSNAAVQFKLPVADGSASQVLKTDGSGNLGWATDSKITEIDQWRLNAATTLGDGNDIITSNWERVDTAPNSGNLGTGMSQSSGVWTFPSTGWWHVTYEMHCFSTSNVRYAYAIVDTAAGTQLTEAQSSIAMNGSSWWGSFVSCQFIVDITDTSADSNKLRFRVNADEDLNIGNSSSDTRTNVPFLKLAET